VHLSICYLLRQNLLPITCKQDHYARPRADGNITDRSFHCLPSCSVSTIPLTADQLLGRVPRCPVVTGNDVVVRHCSVDTRTIHFRTVRLNHRVAARLFMSLDRCSMLKLILVHACYLGMLDRTAIVGISLVISLDAQSAILV